MKVRFQQRDIDRESWESVESGHSVDYAWEEPNMPHKLCVSLETEGVAFRDASEHEYNLDVIKVLTHCIPLSTCWAMSCLEACLIWWHGRYFCWVSSSLAWVIYSHAKVQSPSTVCVSSMS